MARPRHIFELTVLNERWHTAAECRGFRPSTDVYENEDGLVVRVEVAGIREDNFSIEFKDGVLRICGERKDDETKRAYHVMDIPFGPFATEVVLPGTIVIDEKLIHAEYEDGMLRVVMPRSVPHRVEVVEKR